MIRATGLRTLNISLMVILIGITSFFMIIPKTEKHGGETSAAISGAYSQKKTIPPVGADDAEIQAFIDNPDDYKVSDDVDPDYDVDLKDIEQEVELILAGKHPDYPPPPSREDFSSNLDYLNADLEYYKKKVLQAKGTEYQDTFESDIAGIERMIELEKRFIEMDKNTRKIDNYVIDMSVSTALITAQSSEEDFNFYLETVFPSIPSHLKDAVVEKFFIESEILEKSESKSFSVMPTNPTDSHKVIENSKLTDHTDDVNERMQPDQLDDWENVLLKEYPDIFAYPDAEKREDILEKFPSEGSRQLFQDRQMALRKEYVRVLESQLKGIPKDKRDEAISTFRESLSQKWDRDFAESVINQFHSPRDE